MLVFRRRTHERTAVSFSCVPFVRSDDEARHPSEWRVARALAQLDLVVIEGFAVAGDQRTHHRMFRLMGLQVTEAPTLLSTGASDHLVQQLECALGGAWIAITKPEIGIDDPDQVEFGKMMALGDELSTDDEIEAPCSHVIEFLPQSLDGLDEVAREHQDAGLWKQLRGFLLESFHAWPNGRKAFGGMTIRTFSRWRD